MARRVPEWLFAAPVPEPEDYFVPISGDADLLPSYPDGLPSYGDADMGIGLDPVDPALADAFAREQQYGDTLPPTLEPGGVLTRDYTPEESIGDPMTPLKITGAIAAGGLGAAVAGAGGITGLGGRVTLPMLGTAVGMEGLEQQGIPVRKFSDDVGRLSGGLANNLLNPDAAAQVMNPRDVPSTSLDESYDKYSIPLVSGVANALGRPENLVPGIGFVDAADIARGVDNLVSPAATAAGRAAGQVADAMPDLLGDSRMAQRGQVINPFNLGKNADDVPVNPLSDVGDDAARTWKLPDEIQARVAGLRDAIAELSNRKASGSGKWQIQDQIRNLNKELELIDFRPVEDAKFSVKDLAMGTPAPRHGQWLGKPMWSNGFFMEVGDPAKEVAKSKWWVPQNLEGLQPLSGDKVYGLDEVMKTTQQVTPEFLARSGGKSGLGVVFSTPDGQVVTVDASIIAYFKKRYPDATFYVNPQGKVSSTAVLIRNGDEAVGLTMPIFRDNGGAQLAAFRELTGQSVPDQPALSALEQVAPVEVNRLPPWDGGRGLRQELPVVAPVESADVISPPRIPMADITPPRPRPSSVLDDVVPPKPPELPPTPLPNAPPPGSYVTPDLTPTVVPDKGYWPRPLPTQDYVDAGFSPNVFRRTAQEAGKVPGLRQAIAAVNPAALADEPISRALITYNRLLDVGQSGVDAGMAHLRGVKVPFELTKDGRVATLAGKPLWEDVFTAPQRYKLTPDQAEYVRLYSDLTNDASKMLKENAVPFKELGLKEGEQYIHRLVTEIRSIENKMTHTGGGGGRVGAKQAFQKTRFYEQAEEGVANGVKYSQDPLASLEHYVSGAYKSIADKRLADELVPYGETISERMPAAVKQAVERTKADYNRAKQLMAAVNRSYRGERLPPATIASIGKSYPAEAAALKAAGPDNPALQQVEAAARSAMLQAKGDFYQAVGNSARAREQAAMLGLEEAYIPQPAFNGRIFPKEVADRVTAMFGDKGNAWLRAVEKPVNVSRMIQAGIDVGAPLIQGAPVLGKNPAIWAKATLSHYGALARPDLHQRFLVDHADTVKEMVQHRVPVSQSEFFQGFAQGKSPLDKIRQEVLRRPQAAYDTFLDTSRILLWESMKEPWLRSGSNLFEMGDTINHMTGTMSPRALGIGASQRQIESTVMMFAPRYTRAGFALVNDLFRTGAQGNVARNALAGFAGSAMLFYMGTKSAQGVAEGKNPEAIRQDIVDGLTPIKNGRFNSRFMTWRVGDEHIGFGSFFYSLLRLTAGVTDAALNEPQALLKWDTADNPLIQFVRQRIGGAGPVGSFVWDMVEGRDPAGYKVDKTLPGIAGAMAKRYLPFWAESTFVQSPPADPKSLPFQTTGFRTFPVSPSERRNEAFEKAAKAEGLDPNNLNKEQREALRTKYPDLQQADAAVEAAADKRVKNEHQAQTDSFYAAVEKHTANRETDLKPLYESFLSGKITGEQFRKQRSAMLVETANKIAGAEAEYPLALTTREKREAYYRENRIDVRTGHPQDLLVEQYRNIQPQRLPDGTDDMPGFFKQRETFLNTLNQEDREYVKRNSRIKFADPVMQQLENKYQDDLQVLRPYWELKDKTIASTPALKAIKDEAQQYAASPNRDDQLVAQALEAKIDSYMTNLKLAYRIDNPNVDELLVEWGYLDKLVGERKQRSTSPVYRPSTRGVVGIPSTR